MHRIVLLPVACMAVPYVSTLSHQQQQQQQQQQQDSQKKSYLTQICVLFSLQHFSYAFLVLRINERDTIISIHRSSRKVPVIFDRL